MKSLRFILITLCLSVAAGGSAQQAELNILSQSAPKQAPFAKPFALEFSLAHTPGHSVDIDHENLPKDFALTQVISQDNSPGTLTYSITAVPFTLGISTFTLTFELKDMNGKTLAKAASEPAYITVTPVSYFKDQNLREIRPPYIPANWLLWLLLLALIAGAVWWGIWRFKQARLAALTIKQEEDPRPSDEIALSQINALLQSGLWEERQYKVFYITLSDIFRQYLWRRFKVDASADTSVEVLRRVKTIPAMAPLLSWVKAFLYSGDLVKFAKVLPSEQTRNTDINALQQIVTKTAPAQEALTPQAPRPPVAPDNSPAKYVEARHD